MCGLTVDGGLLPARLLVLPRELVVRSPASFALTLLRRSLALIGQPLALVGCALALVRHPLALVGNSLPLVRHVVALLCRRGPRPLSLQARLFSALCLLLTSTALLGAPGAREFPLRGGALALIDRALSPVGEPFALVRYPLALVRYPRSFVGQHLKRLEGGLAAALANRSLSQDVGARRGQALALRNDLLALCGDLLALGRDAFTLRRQLAEFQPITW
ncbi:MAG TPA: hypothetical protein VF032_06950 [Thermoleophilaceae bacterium]